MRYLKNIATQFEKPVCNIHMVFNPSLARELLTESQTRGMKKYSAVYTFSKMILGRCNDCQERGLG